MATDIARAPLVEQTENGAGTSENFFQKGAIVFRENENIRALSQDYLDLKASHDAAVAALQAVRNCFEVEYHDDGRIACLGHDNDGLRSVVRLLDGALAALTTPAAPADDGWIPWAGGECPVDGHTLVTVRLSSDEEMTKPAGVFVMGLDWWKHEGGGGYDIVAYRVRPAAGGAL